VTVTVPEAAPLVTIPGVELVAAGTWKISTGEATFTMEDLANCVAALDCPGVRRPVLKLGHDEPDGAGMRWDGEPAVGYVDNMELADSGAKIVGDFAGMPSWLAEVLPSAYPDRSVEIVRPFVCQIGHAHPAVITAVALLGVSPPGVGVLKSLQDVAALYGVEPAAAARGVRSRGRRAAAVTIGGDIRLIALAAAQPPLRREPTKVEAASKADFATIQADWLDAVDQLVADWAAITRIQRAALVDQVKAAVDDARLDTLAGLAVDSQAAADLLTQRMADLADEAAAEMVREADRQGITVGTVTVDHGRLTEIAATIAALLAGGLAAAAGRRAVQVATPTATGAEIAAIVADHLGSLSDAYLRDQLGGALSTAQNTGRLAVLDDAPKAMYAASEVLDPSTCEFCAAIDGHVFANLDEAAAAYANGGYIDCAGFLRCRGILIAVWDDTGLATAAAPSTSDGPQRTARITVPIALRIEGSGHAQGHRIRFR
jgi:hypothetical protein